MPTHTCRRCGREFASAPVLALHIERCVKLPEPKALIAEYRAANSRILARMYHVSPNWIEEHFIALTSPKRGPLCVRCGIGATYGGALDARGWCGWCQEETTTVNRARHAAVVIGRIAPAVYTE